MLRRRSLILFTLPACIFASVECRAALPGKRSTLYQAARLRGLSQRMSKAYLQAAAQVLADQAHTVITDSLRTSELMLASLQQTVGDAGPARHALSAFGSKAKELFGAVVSPVNAAASGKVVHLSDEVFAAGDTLVQELQNLEKAGYGKLQNLAGRQRALSQRMARDYFVMRIGDGSHWKTNGPAMRKQFGETLQALEAAPLTTAAIKDNLGLVKMQWMLFEEALNNPGDEKSPAHVATTSERMFEVLDTLVDQYEHAMQALA